jgi:hypothetical protein
MKFKYVEALVAMRERTNIVPKIMPEWELPIVEAIHSADGVEMVRKARDVVVDRPAPSSAAEYSRLASVYGSNKEGVLWVAVIYGNDRMGQQALRAAMQSTVLPAETPITPPPVTPELSRDVYEAIKPDIVAGLEDERQLAQARVAAREAAEAADAASAGDLIA